MRGPVVAATLALAALGGWVVWTYARGGGAPLAGDPAREDRAPAAEDGAPGLAPRAAGTRPASPPAPPAMEEPTRATPSVEAPAGRLRVEIVDADSGRPIPRALAMVSHGNRTEGSDAAYEFERPRDGSEMTVVASAVGYFRSEPVRVAASAPGPVRIALRPAKVLAGRVVLEDGTDLPGTDVWIDGPARSRIEARRNHRDATFQFDGVEDGTHRVVVGLKAPFRTVRLVEVPLAAGTLDAVIRVPDDRLRDGGVLVVRVVDPQGAPVAQASVHVVGRGARSGPGPTYSFVLHDATAPRQSGWVAVGNAKDARGQPLPLAPAVVEFDAGATLVVVRLGPERTITGRVVDSSGAPVAGVRASVAFRLADGATEEERKRLGGVVDVTQLARHATTAEDGSFVIRQLRDEAYVVDAEPPPGWALEAPVFARGGDEGVVLRLVSAARATVTVLDPSGNPLVGVRVIARAPGDRPGPLESGPTDERGRTSLLGAVAGVHYVLWVSTEDPRYLPKALEGWAGEDATLRLRPAQSIAGVLVDEDGGAPGDAWVAANDGERSRGGKVDAQGRFRIEGLEPGDYKVTAGLRDGPHSFASAEPPERTVPAGTLDVRIVIPVNPMLVVRVDPAPRGKESVEVFLYPESGRSTSRSVEVGTDGVARVRRCQPDVTYTVWLPPTRDGYALVRGVRAPGHVDVVRRAGQSITVRVGGDVLDATPHVSATLGPLTVSGKALPDGTFEIAGLPPGTWTVTASVLDRLAAKPRTATATAVPGSTVTLEIPARTR